MLGIGIVKVDAGMAVRRGGDEVAVVGWGKAGGMGDRGDWGCGVDDCCDSRPDEEPATELAWVGTGGGGCRWLSVDDTGSSAG